MQTFLIIDPETGRSIGHSSSTAPEYLPSASEVPCSAEQFAEPKKWAWADGELQPIEPEPDPVPPPAPVITYKADLYRRTTEEEAEAIEMALAAAPVRQRRLFESALHLDHSDEAFAFAQEALVGMFGKKRAGELLAAS